MLAETFIHIVIKYKAVIKMKNILAMNNLPPPPSQRSRKMLYAIIAIVIIVVAIAAGAFLLMQKSPNNPNPSSSPTATPYSTAGTTSTPTANPSSSTSATATPAPSSSIQAIANFRSGAYANYTVTTYDNSTGAQTASYPMDWAVTDGNVNGVNVWVLTMTTTFTGGGSTSKTDIIMNLDKSTYQPISGRLLMVSDGQVIFDQTLDLSSAQSSSPGASVVDPNTYVGKETITVAAGTFVCDKAVTTQSGTTSTVWVNSNVPMFGLVKMVSMEGSIVTSKFELVNKG
jgi:hypothetical protein